MASKDLISIIVPVYNVNFFLDRCINSIVSQSYNNLQIILINDGSTDNSGEICNGWGKKDSRICVIHQKNGGLSKARNTGLDIAMGKYIIFVDSDDFIENGMCESLLSLQKENEADIVICNAEHVFDTNNVKFNKNSNVIKFNSKEAILELWYQKSFLPSAWGKLYKSTVFDKVRFTENLLYEDIDIMHELFWNAKKIIYTKSSFYAYVHRDNSITTQTFKEKDLDILKISNKILTFSINKDIKLLKAAQAYAVTAAFRVYLNAPNSNEFQHGIMTSNNIIKMYGKSVMRNNDVRRKTKYGLLLYFVSPLLLKLVYKKVDRWES